MPDRPAIMPLHFKGETTNQQDRWSCTNKCNCGTAEILIAMNQAPSMSKKATKLRVTIYDVHIFFDFLILVPFSVRNISALFVRKLGCII